MKSKKAKREYNCFTTLTTLLRYGAGSMAVVGNTLVAKKQSAEKPVPITLGAEMPRGGMHCTALAFSPDRQRLVACGYDRKLHLYDVAATKRIASNQEHSGSLDAIAFSPDSTRFATVGQQKANRKSQGGELIIWQTSDGKLLKRTTIGPRIEDGEFGPLLFSPSGTELVCLIEDDEQSEIARLDPTSGKRTGGIEIEASGPMAFSPDGKTLALAQNGTLVLLDFLSGKQRKAIKRKGRTRALCYSPDGKRLAVVDAACAVQLLSASTGKPLATLQETRPDVQHVQFSADGTLLATIGATMHGTSEAPIRIWDIQSQQVRVAFAGRFGVEHPRGFPGSCALSADLQYFANAGNKTRLWRITM